VSPASLLFAIMLSSVLCSGLALGQDWKEIKTPPTRRDAVQMFRFDAELDPLDDPAQWTPAAHDQSVEATMAAADGREPGDGALRIDYDFAGDKDLEYVDIAGNLPLPEDAQALGLWMFGGAHPLAARVRVRDAGDEIHQFNLGAFKPGEWSLGIAALEAGGHWGGDNNGRLDAPCTLISILFDKLSTGFDGTGECRIAELGLYQRIPERLQPHGITVFVPNDRELLVYAPYERVELAVALDAPAAVSARLVDPFGAVVDEREIEITAEDELPVAHSFTAPGVGAYDLQLRPADQEDSLDGPWADFRFAVLPKPKEAPEDTPFGVCTHFGQAWPTSVMHAIARAGIRLYRDEISWNSVEQEKGELAIPKRYADYVAYGADLDLEPLIIADYSNKHYDDNGYPVSEEARVGFARYAGTLAAELKDNLRYFEIWNEWCGGCGMHGLKGEPEDYPSLFIHAAHAIRREHPNATVVGVGGEWGTTADDNVGIMMGDRAGEAMDAFSIHPYHYPQLAGQWLRDHLEGALETAATAAGKPVPLWITEIGWPTQMDARGSSFLHQARCLVRMNVIALSTEGVERIVWYDFKDDGHNITYNENNFGLVHHENFLLAPKPAYAAYAQLISAVHGRELTEHDVREDGLWRTVFVGENDYVAVLWAAEEGQSIRYPVPQYAEVTDMFGHPLLADEAIDVTWDPVFVKVRR